MARYERNRGMLFGSWTGNNITASVEVDTLLASGSTLNVTSSNVNISTFASKVTNSGDYGFYRVDSKWQLNDTPVVLSDYGITTSGTPKSGDMINIVYTKAGSGWEPLGKDNDNLTKEMNPDSEKIKNILGQSVVRLNGYESEISLDPYYIDSSSKMYKQLLHNAIAERYDETHIKGKIAEAFFTTANKELRKMKGFCFIREAWYIPQSTGGDTAAFGIPVTITPIGASTYGTIVYDMATHEATITNATLPNDF